MTAAARAKALTTAVLLSATLTGCCRVYALPVPIYNAPSVSFVPIAVSTPTPRPSASPRPTAKPVPVKVRTGIASTYGNGYDGWLALPEGPGIRVRICGPAACIIRVSNDAGPDLAMQRKGRIVDLSGPDFNRICGCRWQTVGLLRGVTVEYLP